MAYILKDNIALRSWKNRKNAIIYKDQYYTTTCVGKKVFEQLEKCDGSSDYIPEDYKNLLAGQLIEECEVGEKTLSDWQKPRIFDNNYKPLMKLAITEKCNFNCLHCFNAADNMPICKELSYEDICSILDQAADYGVLAVAVTGGEPMMHPDFLKIIEAIYDRGMYLFELCTNGWFITQPILDRMKELNAYPKLKISFDGIGYHDWMRNMKGAEKKALECIQLLVDNGFNPGVHLNVNRKNRDCVLETLNLLDSMGVNFCKMLPTTPAPRWEENANGMTMEIPEYHQFALETTQEYLKKERYMTLQFWRYLDVEPRNNIFRFRTVHCPDDYNDNLPMCDLTDCEFAIDSFGKIYPCMQMSGWMNKVGIDLGNVHDTPLKELLDGSAYSDYLYTYRNGAKADKNGVCRQCEFLSKCRTGYPCTSITYGGDIYAPDPFQCDLFHGGYYNKTITLFESLGDKWKNKSSDCSC